MSNADNMRKYINLLLESTVTNEVIVTADKINDEFKKNIPDIVQYSDRDSDTGNLPGKLYKEVSDSTVKARMRGNEEQYLNATMVKFCIPVVVGERAERNATNSEKKVQTVFNKAVWPLRGQEWFISQPTREKIWGNINNPIDDAVAGYLYTWYMSKIDPSK